MGREVGKNKEYLSLAVKYISHVCFSTDAHSQQSISSMSCGYQSRFCLTVFIHQTQGCFCSGGAPEAERGDKKESAERGMIKRYSQVFVILIDIVQLQNVRVLD